MFSQFVLGGIMSGKFVKGWTGWVAIALLISGSGAVVQPALAQIETETKVDVPAEPSSPVRVAQVGMAGVEGIGHSEGNRIIRRFLTQADNRVANGSQRLRVLRVQPIVIEKDPITGGLAPQATVLLVVFNYTTGKALRYQVNAQTGKTLSSEVLSGQPAASEEEILAAAEVLYRQPELSRVAQQGILEDGFAVTPPPGQPTNHRYIQLRILNGNRTQVLRTVTVNLTQLAIAPIAD
jgi:hypothetical protein